ncbi:MULTISPECIES: YraN family protein [Acetobacter]|uniref:UPF0102 protein OQ497_09500 n=1 Tax=Acetobacter thailandicus TaxID=1502842 RepID=A0ABT3QFX6_9PROT|nr:MULTISPECIES: YraN family protein [Acetobacter]MBS0985201.1 YraN family protein [Acetobacter thailandicus]MBS1002774.1 YraN family protein [Acetobacter thailandicus]MCX2564193.1 YraN family protein [Acetobacter thailandicus]
MLTSKDITGSTPGYLKEKRRLNGALAHQSGRQAEHDIKEKLIISGWQILLERARTPCGEIDLVVLKENLLCFIEVKKRRTIEGALCSLRPQQQRRLYKAAEYLLSVYSDWHYENIRFDLIVTDAKGNEYQVKDILREY